MKFLIIGAIVMVVSGCNGDEELHHHSQPVSLGENEFTIEHYTSGDPGLQLINIHEDEQTSIEASLEYLRDNSGSLTYLKHDQTRRIEFELDGEMYSIDPNRIYTDQGIENTLEDGDNYSEAAHEEVAVLAETILQFYEFDRQDVVIAMHNNQINGFSIESYAKGGNLAHNAERVHIEEDQDINDFFYLTDERFYEFLTDRGFNAMLQDEDEVTDDGSLSVYSGMQGKPYINVEAGHDHLEKQLNMLRVVEEMLRETGLL